MKKYNNIISYIIWIFVAIFLGMISSYLLIKSTGFTYTTLYEKTKVLISQNIPLLKKNPANTFSGYSDAIKENDPKDLPLLTPLENKFITLGFVGDIIPGLNTNNKIFTDASYYTEQPDIMIGNLEGTITDNENKKCKIDAINCYAFNGDENFVNLLKNASFSVLNISNNHFNDFGPSGQEETLKEISNANIVVSGTKNEVTYIKRNNINIGIIGFSIYDWTTNMNNEDKLRETISEARLNSDIVVVMFHGGAEGEIYGHTPKGEETYLGESRGDLRKFSHECIDLGADIVVGSGPHTLRGMEIYNGKLIAYSLGNFASSNKVSLLGSLKISGILNTKFEKNGDLISGDFLPFTIDTLGMPHPDQKGTAISMINKLSKTDFENNSVKLGPSGSIILPVR